jgi:hypothetical protein
LEDYLVNPSTEQIQWIPTSPGIYSVEVYVWNGMDSSIPLVEQNQYKIKVLQ